MNITYENIRSELIRMDALMGDLTPDEIANAPERIYQFHLAGLNRLAATPVSTDASPSNIRAKYRIYTLYFCAKGSLPFGNMAEKGSHEFMS